MKNYLELRKNMISKLKNKKILFAPWAAKDIFYSSRQQWMVPFKKFFGSFLIFDPKEYISTYGRDEMNRRFLDLIKREKPDFVFLWLISQEFDLETFVKIKEISPNTKTINYFGDDDERFVHFTRYYAKYLDYCLNLPQLTSEPYKKDKLKNIFFSIGVNTNHFKPLNLEKKYDITFVGTPKKDRYDYLKLLLSKGIDVTIFGPGWEKYPEFSKVYGGMLDDKEFVKVMNQTKISLALTKNYNRLNHFKGRIFEINACKSFALIEYASKFSDLLKDNEMAMFRGNKDLFKKINYYLKNEKEREKISTNAYNRVLDTYNIDKELTYFFDKVFNDPNFIKEEIKSKKLTYTVSEKEASMDRKLLKKKIEKYDYISFSKGDYLNSKLKDSLQAYSLEITGKKISCCNYFLNSKKLGDYLSLISINVLRRHGIKCFSSFLNINQLMVSSDYFLDNLDIFRKLFNNQNVQFITEENTAFISIPLLRIKNLEKKFSYPSFKKVFSMNFTYSLSSLIYQRNLLKNNYLFNLIFSSYEYKNFILRYLYENNIKNKKYMKKLFTIFTLKSNFYS